MANPVLPQGIVVQLRSDSWIPAGQASPPRSLREEDFRGLWKGYPNCMAAWRDDGSYSSGNEYWMLPGDWFDLATNVTGPDRRQGALLGFYIDTLIVGTISETDSWSFNVNSLLRGTTFPPSSTYSRSFGESDSQTKEACSRVQMWLGSPQLPIFNRPSKVAGAQVDGDWFLSGAPSGSDILVLNSTAVFQEVLGESTTTATTMDPALDHSSSTKVDFKIILPAVLVPVVSLILFSLFFLWLLKRRRARRGRSQPHQQTFVATSPQVASPSIPAYTLSAISTPVSVIRPFTLNSPSTTVHDNKPAIALVNDEKPIVPLAIPTLPGHNTNTPSAKQASREALVGSKPAPSSSTAVDPPPLSSTAREAEEDDETALRELRGAMRSAGFTLNSLLARIGASPAPRDEGLPAYVPADARRVDEGEHPGVAGSRHVQ